MEIFRDSCGRLPLLPDILAGPEECSFSCVQSYRRVRGHLNPNVNVGSASKKPGKGGSGQPPIVPFIRACQLPIPVECQGTPIETPHLLQALHHSMLVFLSERLDHGSKNLMQFLLLVPGHFHHRDSRKLSTKTRKPNPWLIRSMGNQRQAPLSAI